MSFCNFEVGEMKHQKGENMGPKRWNIRRTQHKEEDQFDWEDQGRFVWLDNDERECYGDGKMKEY